MRWSDILKLLTIKFWRNEFETNLKYVKTEFFDRLLWSSSEKMFCARVNGNICRPLGRKPVMHKSLWRRSFINRVLVKEWKKSFVLVSHDRSQNTRIIRVYVVASFTGNPTFLFVPGLCLPPGLPTSFTLSNVCNVLNIHFKFSLNTCSPDLRSSNVLYKTKWIVALCSKGPRGGTPRKFG